uniref:PITH domain-containing protein n=1 Tax=Panagrellus redivivus TaxID=6233 RepID=A0A7E4UM22_PANRE
MEGSRHILDSHEHAEDFRLVIFGQEGKENLLDEQTLCDFLRCYVTDDNYLGTREQCIASVEPNTTPRKQTQLYFSLPMSTKILVICPNPNKTDDPENPDPRRIRRLKTAYIIRKCDYNRFESKKYICDESRNRNTL